MLIDPNTSLLDIATYLPSPHYNQRPDETVIDLIVIHNISLPPGVFGGPYIEDFFCGKLDVTQHPYFRTINQLKVSAHLLIKRDAAVTQFVPFALRAWHAGESCFQGRNNCNDFSIGIELEGTDHVPYTEAQYQQLAAITQLLLQVYPAIKKDKIVGHRDIAPQRKTDPGEVFNWKHYLEMI